MWKPSAANTYTTPVTTLGQQEGRRVFREGPKFLNYVQYFQTVSNTFFHGGRKF